MIGDGSVCDLGMCILVANLVVDGGATMRIVFHALRCSFAMVVAVVSDVCCRCELSVLRYNVREYVLCVVPGSTRA